MVASARVSRLRWWLDLGKKKLGFGWIGDFRVCLGKSGWGFGFVENRDFGVFWGLGLLWDLGFKTGSDLGIS